MPNRFQGFGASLRRFKVPPRMVFVLMGVASTVWFLSRVIPKPSRATYPCMQAAAPIMSGFVVYLLGLAGSVLAFRRARMYLRDAKYLAFGLIVLCGLVSAFLSYTADQRPVFANSKLLLGPNEPVGEARGIYPGRVVWVWDSSATNQSCTNVYGDGWFLPKNTNLNVVVPMVDTAVMRLTGHSTIPDSWDVLFRHFNQTHGRGDVGYNDTEKIFIRTNQVSASDNTIGPDYTVLNTSRYGMAETSPQVVLAILRQLVNQCGISQERISVGDPMKHMYKHVYDMWHGEFPNVTYIDKKGTLGRTIPVASSEPTMFYSDRGKVLRSGGTTGDSVFSDYYPTVITEASYVITIPALKAHARAGVTLNAKVHFGSNMRSSATHLHGGLPMPDKTPTRTGYGLYRVQVDLMGNKHLGEKTVLFVVDGLWGGSEANDPPRKFSMGPFNNDWTSSVLVSQDQVALESVCFDFLKAEFTADNPFGSYPQIDGVDDYILQAADSSFWPADVDYDPENDGSIIGSLGVCEHWNNSVDKKYSRNLGTGNGIELIRIDNVLTNVGRILAEIPREFSLSQNYPNPFNSSTHIRYFLGARRPVSLKIFDLRGRELVTLVNRVEDEGEHEVLWSTGELPSGTYLCRLASGNAIETRKLVLQK